jgi:hypothetical protein
MKIKVYMMAALVALLSGSCVFSPKSEDPDPGPGGKWEDPTTPDKVINNLKVAFDNLDINKYRDCLHNNYFYTSPSTTDNPDIRWSKSEDVSTVGNVMTGSKNFVFTAVENSRHEEYGKDYPPDQIPEGAVVVDDHPTEKWVVVNYTVDMEIMTKEHGEYDVHQFMEFKFLQDPASKLYSIILWNDLTSQ